MENNSLRHHGILGMKWGVRRTQAQLGNGGAKKSKPKSGEDSEDSKKKSEPAPKPKKKSLGEMSDDELNASIRRMELERRYSDLSPKEVSHGKKIADSILNKMVVPAAEDIGKQLVKSGMAYASNKIFKLDEELKVFTNNKKK